MVACQFAGLFRLVNTNFQLAATRTPSPTVTRACHVAIKFEQYRPASISHFPLLPPPLSLSLTFEVASLEDENYNGTVSLSRLKFARPRARIDESALLARFACHERGKKTATARRETPLDGNLRATGARVIPVSGELGTRAVPTPMGSERLRKISSSGEATVFKKMTATTIPLSGERPGRTSGQEPGQRRSNISVSSHPFRSADRANGFSLFLQPSSSPTPDVSETSSSRDTMTFRITTSFTRSRRSRITPSKRETGLTKASRVPRSVDRRSNRDITRAHREEQFFTDLEKARREASSLSG